MLQMRNYLPESMNSPSLSQRAEENLSPSKAKNPKYESSVWIFFKLAEH